MMARGTNLTVARAFPPWLAKPQLIHCEFLSPTIGATRATS
jgi:hypothetical protein